jgi:Ser/Thr protein kinase RdoA (MazF antagonist)
LRRGVSATSFYDLSQDDQIERLRGVAFAALASYAVRDVQIEPIGYSNNLFFRVDTADARYALRVCRDRFGVADLQRDTEWLAALDRDTGLAVATPHPADDGSLYVEASAPGVSDPRYCVLFRWVDGRHLSGTHTETPAQSW